MPLLSRKARFVLVAALLAATPSTAFGSALSRGLEALAKGDNALAYKKFRQSSEPRAAFEIAMMAFSGKLSNCDPRCQFAWAKKAADQDYLPAGTLIGSLYLNDGQRENAIAVFKFMARWNEADARSILGQMGIDVPTPDLWNSHQALLAHQQAEQQTAAALARQQNQAALGYLLGCAIAGGRCFESPTYSSPSSISARPIEPVSQRPPTSFAPPASGGASSPQSSPPTILCPKGSYVSGGQCVMAPDGTYTAGRPTMAPDGTYVSGQPKMAPDGSFVGGNGSLTLCPNGKYVAGRSCRLAPDGTYVGVP